MKRLALLLLAAVPLFAQGKKGLSQRKRSREDSRNPGAERKAEAVRAFCPPEDGPAAAARSPKTRRAARSRYGRCWRNTTRSSKRSTTFRNDALKHKTDIQLGINAVTEAENKFIGQLQKIKDSSPRDLDMYSIELSEAIATHEGTAWRRPRRASATRTEKVTAEAEQEKKGSERAFRRWSARRPAEKFRTRPKQRPTPRRPGPAASRRPC